MQQQNADFKEFKLNEVYPGLWNFKTKVKITAIYPIKEVVTKNNQDMKIFNFSVIDVDSTEMNVQAFNDVCDTFKDQIQDGKVYYLKNFNVKMNNNKQFNKGHDYILQLNKASQVEEVQNDTTIQNIGLQLLKIDQIPETQIQYFDIVGIIQDEGQLEKLNKKNTNEELTKRSISIFDETLHSIPLTLWNEKAKMENLKKGNGILVRGVKINEHLGFKNLALTMKSVIEINPENLEEYKNLKNWYDQQENKDNLNIESLNKELEEQREQVQQQNQQQQNQFQIYKNYEQVQDAINLQKQIKLGEKKYINVRAFIMYIPDNDKIYYECCNQKDCLKKCHFNEETLKYKCPVHGEISSTIQRYLFRLKISDETNGIYVQVSDKIAQQILNGFKASEVKQTLVEQKDQQKLRNIFKGFSNIEYPMTLLLSKNMYQEKVADSYQIIKIIEQNEASIKKECQLMLEESNKILDKLEKELNQSSQ